MDDEMDISFLIDNILDLPVEILQRNYLDEDEISAIVDDVLDLNALNSLYEAQFTEFSQNQNSTTAPATNTLKSELPLINITQGDLEKYYQCTICCEEFCIDEECSKLNCEHLFHKICIIQWLQINNVCPLCRQEVTYECKDEVAQEQQVNINDLTGEYNPQ